MEEKMILGLDESGTSGDDIGPVIVAGFMYPESEEDTLTTYEVVDSKKMFHARTRQVTTELEEDSNTHTLTESIPATDIRESSVTVAEHVARAMQSIISRMNPDRIHADPVSVEGGSVEFQNRLLKSSDKSDTTIKSAAGLDASDLWVSAASLFAKRARDEAIADIQKDIFQKGKPVYPEHGTDYDEWKSKFKAEFQSPESPGYKYRRKPHG